MIAGLKPYTAMKDSGIPWLGEVPAHWAVLPGRACFRKKKVANLNLQESTVLSLSYGQIVVKPMEKLHGLVPASFETYQIINPMDIVIRPTDLQNDQTSLRFGFSQHRGIITSAYLCFYTVDGLIPKYGHRLLHAYDLKKVFYGLGAGLRQNLDWTDFKYLPCSIPPLPEQTAIIRFLDHADRRIRRYIRAKQKLIALLEEQKQAIIHQAVTGQIDICTDQPYPAYKPSGVEWLGDVPAHWEVIPFKRRVGFQEGPGIMAADFRESGVPLLRISCLRKEVATLSGCNYLDPDMVGERWNHFAVREGDYLLSASASTGAVALATTEVAGAIPYTGIIRLWTRSQQTVMKYVRLFMNSRLFQDQIDLAKSGVGIEHFGPKHLNMMVMVLPPVAEQEAIANAFKKAFVPLAGAIAGARREIDLLREYRTRLIADVVTGKLDVREAVAALPEVDPLGADDELDEPLDADVEPALDELDATLEDIEA